ncbi:MAG: ATP-binding protein [Roseomonas sp.]|nr:ATP-binding protein [Roseomonas sp.]
MSASFSFRPARSFTERAGLFVALVGGTNSGKTFSALRLARGIAGPKGKVAVLDTEGGRTLHLKEAFDFDVMVMEPPFKPSLFAEAAEQAETAGYDCLLIDSFSMEWAGIGGVLAWQEAEMEAAVQRAMARQDNQRSEYQIRESGKMAAWIKPKMAHKAMVLSFLQRRMPIIFSIRGEESIKPGERPGDKPTKLFKAVCQKDFPFEITVSFRLASEAKGIIDLSDPKAWKMEGAHAAIFRDGDQLSEEHGAKLAAWACGDGLAGQAEAPAAVFHLLTPDARTVPAPSIEKWQAWCLSAIGKVGREGITEWGRAMLPHIDAVREAGHDDAADAVMDAIFRATSADDGFPGGEVAA